MLITPALVFGASQALTGALGTFSKFNQQQSQTDAINQQRADQYNYQVRQYQLEAANRQNIYNQKLAEYKQGVFEDYRGYGRALVDSQERLSELYGQAAFNRQQQNIGLQQSLGQISAAGRTGSSASRLMGAQVAQYGRGQALTMDNLLRARYSTIRTNERLRDQLTSSIRQRYGQVALQPTMPLAPPEPTFQAGPSRLGLMAGLAGNAVSGLSGAADIKKAGINKWSDIFGSGGGGENKFDLTKNFFGGNGSGSFLPPTPIDFGFPRY